MTPAELRAWREGHGLTQEQFALLLGLGGRQAAVSDYERGRVKFNGVQMRLVTERLDSLLRPAASGTEPAVLSDSE